MTASPRVCLNKRWDVQPRERFGQEFPPLNCALGKMLDVGVKWPDSRNLSVQRA